MSATERDKLLQIAETVFDKAEMNSFRTYLDQLDSPSPQVRESAYIELSKYLTYLEKRLKTNKNPAVV
ncbi:MAG: hypothetical protein JWN30_1992 [Bacilli bacterium]|nr:hypothetical protein [Bacilli bacterium]